MIIAVDGPAASGKGTIARALAAHYALPHLDTGLLYRATGLQVMHNGGDPEVESDGLEATQFGDAMLHDPSIRSEAASRAASVVSAYPSVRLALLARQRAFSTQVGGAVLDGRDIGTVIVPAATVKLFVTAPTEVRARRRFAQLAGEGGSIAYDQVLADIITRDRRDSDRAHAPLKMAEDAILLETGGLDIADAVRQAVALSDARILERARD